MADPTGQEPGDVEAQGKQDVTRKNVLEFAAEMRALLEKAGHPEEGAMVQDCIMKLAQQVGLAVQKREQAIAAARQLVHLVEATETALYEQPPNVMKARAMIAEVTRARKGNQQKLRLVTGGEEKKG